MEQIDFWLDLMVCQIMYSSKEDFTIGQIPKNQNFNVSRHTGADDDIW